MTATLQAIRARLEAVRGQLEAAPTHRPRPRIVQLQESECSPVWMAPVEQIEVAPERFQFRLATSPGGTCGRLRGCDRFRPELAGALLVWRDGGRVFLVDGHHRLELARRCGVESLAVLAIEAADDREARLVGAMSNLSNGTAGAIELARLLRDDPELRPRDLITGFGIARNTKPLEQACLLRALSDQLFTDAAIGLIELDLACALCATDDHGLQAQLWAQSQRRQWDASQLQEAAMLAQQAPQGRNVADGVLPGFEALMNDACPLLDQLLSIRAAVRGQLRLESRASKIVGHHRAAEALERTGAGLIDQQRAREVRAEAEVLLQRFSALAALVGPLAEKLNAMAAEVAAGRTVARVVDESMPQIREILSAELS